MIDQVKRPTHGNASQALNRRAEAWPACYAYAAGHGTTKVHLGASTADRVRVAATG
jgi:hypothetical protein